MTTFSALKTAVSKRLLDINNTAVSADDIGEMINASVRYWKLKSFWFNRFSEDVTLTAGDDEVPVPTTNTMLAPFQRGGLVVLRDGGRYDVEKVRVEQFDAEASDTEGLPYIYTYKNGEWLTQDIPDQAYTATWYGLKDYPALTAELTNDFLTHAEDLIKYDTISRALVEFRLDEERASVFAAGAQSEYDNLISHTKRLTGTGILAVSTIL